MTRIRSTLQRFALIAAAVPAFAGAQDLRERLYVELYINGVDQLLIVNVERRDDRFYTTPDELAAAGLRVDDLAVAADGTVDIDAIPEVSYRYLPLEQRLELVVPPARREPDRLGYNTPSTTMPRSNKGLVLNYAINIQSEPLAVEQRTSRQLVPFIDEGYGVMPRHREADFRSAYDARNRTTTLDTDLRYFAPYGLFANRGFSAAQGDESEYVRYDSFWTYTELEPMRTWTVGDFISSSLTWTRAVRLGGVRAARNFDVRPDLVTFPVPLLGANAVVPTTVDLYVNGRRQFSGSTDAGPFVVVDPPVLTGAGDISLVYRDSLGREVAMMQPLYVDSRMLDAGLSDYALEVGYPRQGYGTLSSEYGQEAATAGSLRYGVNDLLTLEGHAESVAELDNGGVGALVALGHFGVLSASYSVSSDAGARGKQASLGYQYVAQHWSMDVYGRRTHDEFHDIGTLEGSPLPTEFNRASVSVSFGNHTGAINYTHQDDEIFGRSRIISAGYNSSWSNSRISTSFTLFRSLENDDTDGVYFGVSVNFGDRNSIYSGASRVGDDETVLFGTSSPVDYDQGGFGWNLYSEHGNDDYQRTVARLNYRNRFGDWAALVEEMGDENVDDKTNMSLYGTGALVVMRGGVFASRAIYDGFALVSTSGTADVPVLRENRLVDSTNARGYLLIPDLPAYRTSRLGIDPLELPIDVNVGAVSLEANPRSFSGVVVEFPLERFQGATVVLVDAQGQPLPPGLRATLLGSGESALIGFDGRVFFPALEPDNRISVDTDDGTCEVDVPFGPGDVMRTIGPFACAVNAP